MSGSVVPVRQQGGPVWPRVGRAVLTFLFVVAAAPLIGGFTTIGGAMVIGALFSGEGVIRTLVLVGQMIVMVGMFSYLFGLAPAALAGFCLAVMTYLGRPVGYGLAVAVGVAVALAFTAAIYFDHAFDTSGEKVNAALFLIVPAVISSVVSLWLCRRLGLVAPPA